MAVLSTATMAYPPAPHHEVYGTLRDERGHPLSQTGSVHMSDGEGQEITRGPVDPTIAPGVNYSLKVPMDAGILAELYRPTALLPQMPYTVEVVIGTTIYVPIEVQVSGKQIGEPGERTRLDLTLGVDSDGDGLPDSWEFDVIDSDPNDGIETLAQVDPQGDIDGDGMRNDHEYIAGTYAFEGQDLLTLEIAEVINGIARLRFLAITGRTYTLEATSDLEAYTAASFSVNPDGSNDVLAYRASGVTFQDIYVPNPEDHPSQIFRLRVE